MLRFRVALVHAVAADAPYVGLGVRRTFEVRMRSRVAGQTCGVHVLGRSFGGIENLGGVAATIHVGLARSVAAFAGDPALAMHLRDLGVRIVSKFLRGLFVAGRARFRTNELARIGLQCLRTGWFVAFAGAAFAAAQSMNAPSKSMEQMHDPARFLGAFSMNRRRTGPSICIKYHLGSSRSTLQSSSASTWRLSQRP